MESKIFVGWALPTIFWWFETMPEYRRPRISCGTYFLTLVTNERRPILASESAVAIVRAALQAVQAEVPFQIDGGVILPDHVHFLWTIEDSDISKLVGRFKVKVTRELTPMIEQMFSSSSSRQKHRESSIWQRRFWDHFIRDDEDFRKHLDYIHFNPVKHGPATCPHAWNSSSFAHWVQKGAYDLGWCCGCNGQAVFVPMDLKAGE